jgi:hypothetical protein
MMIIYPKSLLQAAAILVSFLLYIQPLAAQTAVQPQGAGTVASPYLISNWQELYWISQTTASWDKQFNQTADIDLAGAVPNIKTWNSNTGWTPIGNWSTSFSGNYDGGGHVINELYINRPSSYYQALFGYTSSSAEIHNLGVTGASVIGSWYLGVLVGVHSGNISNCFTIGSVTATNYAGGFAGSVGGGGRISNSFSRASVNRNNDSYTTFGGFAGSNSQGKITNCYSTGRVMYLTGSSPTNKGFVGGVNNSGNFSMAGNYWDTQASGQTTGTNAAGKTTALMQTQTAFMGWDFANTWAIDPQINAGYPYLKTINTSKLHLSEAYIYQTLSTMAAIKLSGALTTLGKSTTAEFGFLINTSPQPDLSASGHLAKIDLGIFTSPAEISGQFTGLSSNTTYYICAYSTNEHGTFYSPAIPVKTTEQASAIPAGAGTLANPYLISNWQELYWISQTSTSWDKHFLQTADIDLSLAEPSITTWDNGAGFTPIGNIKAIFSGNYNGGDNVISGLYINRSSSDRIALFGQNSNVIKNLGITEADIKGNEFVGVLVGVNYGNISNCFTIGSVTATNYAGGFAGYVGTGGRISNSFSRASVNLNGNVYNTFGGFAGYNSQGIITNCYSTGKVMFLTGSSLTDRGFVGSAYTGGSFSMTGNYWDTQASGQTTGTNAAGKTTALMQTQTTFMGWDFTNTWAIDPQINAGYPYLKTINTSKLHLSEAYIYQTLSTMDAIKLSGVLTTLGKSTTAESGFLINTSPQPNLSASGHIAKIDLGIFTSPAEISGQFTGLSSNTTYYICAYSTNEHGTFYSPAIPVKTTEQASALPEGAGTLAKPYLISNWQELYWISQNSASWNKHFLQTADIDLAVAVPSIKTWNSNTGWTPIGRWDATFSGNYDGGGYVIIGLYINRPSSPAQALFGYTSAVSKIHNLGVTGAEVSGWIRGVSIMVGTHSGNISNCFTSGTVSAEDRAGGFAGYVNPEGRISNSFSRASISRRSGTSTSFGGFAGQNYQGSITNCYSTGRVSYATGTSPTNKGFAGEIYSGSSYAMSGNYWDNESSGQLTTSGIASGKTTAEMKTQLTFDGWDFTDTWTINPLINAGYPYLAPTASLGTLSKPETSVSLVETLANSLKVNLNLLSAGASNLSSVGIVIDSQPLPDLQTSRKIEVNINALQSGSAELLITQLTKNTVYYVRSYAINSYGIAYSDQIIVQTLPVEPIAPIGSGDEQNPYLISSLQNLYWIAVQVNKNGNDFTGKHFMQTNDIDVSETKLWNKGEGWEPIGCSEVVVRSYSFICTYPEFNGWYDGAGFEISNLNIYLPSIDKYEIDSASTIGLFGSIGLNGLVKDLGIVNATVYGGGSTGALAGVNNGTILKCYATGTVYGYNFTGGIVGRNNGSMSQSIAECTVDGGSGDPSQDGSSAGGFVGFNSGTISASISKRAGFVDQNTGTIKNCYSISTTAIFFSENSGTITNSYSLGSFAYWLYSGVTGCFWDTETSGTTLWWFRSSRQNHR